jgi:mannitol-specific phosphotransferase system IIBC component
MASSIPAAQVKQIIVACEAGMGSSLMSVNALKKKLRAAGVVVEVIHKPARAVPPDAQVVVVHKGLAEVVRRHAPGAVVVAFNQFLNDPAFDNLVRELAAKGDVKERA